MQIISNKYTNKSSKESNKEILFGFGRHNKTLRNKSLELVLDAAELYKKERDAATCYRVTAGLSLVASNVLFNITGESSYATITELRNYDEEDQEYEFQEDEVLLSEDGWWYYLTGETLNACQKEYLEPRQDKFSFLTPQGHRNWDFYLTYPARKDDTLAFDGVGLKNGIRVNSIVQVSLNNRNVLKFFTSIQHGLAPNDTVAIENFSSAALDGEYQVYRVGDENQDYLGNCFIIDTTQAPVNASTNLISVTKTIDGVKSLYFKRDFKKLTSVSDYSLYPNSFSKSIYGDKNFLITFEDVDLVGLSDYLGRPLTQMYLTAVKSPLVSGETYWSSIKSGVNSVFAFSDYDINTITTSYNTPIDDDVNANGDYFFGDIVEYNPASQTEIVLDVAHHRFNTRSRDGSGYEEGYWYRPHYALPVKAFNENLSETFDQEDAPGYAASVDGKYIWREILPNSFTNDPDIPFANGCHYLYSNVCVLVKRQDPCMEFNLGGVAVSGECVSFGAIVSKGDDETC